MIKKNIFNINNLEIFLLGIIYSIIFTLVNFSFGTWLADLGSSKVFIGFVSFFSIPYTFRFLWSNLFSECRIILLSDLIGNHKAWLLIINFFILLESILLFYLDINLDRSVIICIFIFTYSLLGSCQASIIDCYRINKYSQQNIITSYHIIGYRTGNILASGLLFMFVDILCKKFILCGHSINWKIGYLVFSIMIFIITLCIIIFFPRTDINIKKSNYLSQIEKIKLSINDVINVKNGIYILCFMTIYRLPDAFISSMLNIFFLDLGYSLTEIGFYSKAIGFTTNMLGLFLGSYIINFFETKKYLLLGASLQMSSNFCFVLMSYSSYNIIILCITLFVENICAGIATCCIMTYISNKCKTYNNPSTSYAFIESVYKFIFIIINVVSGIYAEIFTWNIFYISSILLGFIPLYLVYKIK